MTNISVSKATNKETKRFNRKEWKKQNAEHYGQPIKWVEKDFIFKATERGKIIGCAKFKYESGVVYIKNVIIAENKRGKGIGRKLMERVEEFSKKLKAHKIYLFTGKIGAPGNFMKNWDTKKLPICLSTTSKSISLFIPKRFRKNDRNSFR